MSNKTFEPGQEVFFEDGEMAYYIGKVGDYHAVEPVYERHNFEDHYTYTGKPILVGKVYPEPLTVKKSAQIAELDAEIEEKQKKLREVSGELREAENSQKKLLDNLAQNEALAQIENVMNGNITHVVVTQYGDVKIIKFPGRTDTYNEPKLTLTIGLIKKVPDWGYSIKDSYCTDDCLPFSSEEEAIAFAKQHILSKATEKEIAQGYSAGIERIVKQAEEFGVTLPDFFLDAHYKNQINAAKKNQTVAQAELDKANKALAELGGGDDAE